jgi:DUF4097 and DUF4098 domain-containing protein YvlB
MVTNNKFNNFVKYLAITCITCFLVGFGMIFARIDDYSDLASKSWDMDLNVVDEKSAGTADNVSDIYIKSGSAGVNILKSGSSEIKAVLSGFTGGAVSSSDYKLSVDRSSSSNGDRIDIRVDGRSFVVMGTSYYKLDVYIPESYSKNLDTQLGSGSINIEGFSLSHVVLNSSSGSIKAGQLKADAMDVKSSSGSVTLTDNTASNLTANSSSGSIKAERLDAGVMNIKTTSGSASLTDGTASMLDSETSSGSLKLEGITVKSSINAFTTSGSIRAAFKEFEGKANIRSSSGSCRVDFPDDASLQINASSSSGSLKCALPLNGSTDDHSISGSVNGGKNPVDIRTSSGSVRIE